MSNEQQCGPSTGPGGVPAGAQTHEYYRTSENLPERFDNPECFQGYAQKKESPMFRTSNSEYGSKPPSVHTVPITFHPNNQAFTKHLGPKGMYRNHSLNCAMDTSRVPDH